MIITLISTSYHLCMFPKTTALRFGLDLQASKARTQQKDIKDPNVVVVELWCSAWEPTKRWCLPGIDGIYRLYG